MTQPESIGAILARSQPALLPTSANVCGKCGATVHVLKNPPLCYECTKEKMLAERIEKAKQELPSKVTLAIIKWESQSQMPAYFISKTFANYDQSLQLKAFNAIKNLQWRWDEHCEKPPKSLVLLSPGLYGVGKTHLVCAFINQVFETEEKVSLDPDGYAHTYPCPAYFISENDLLRRIRNSYNDKEAETEEHIYQTLNHYDVLVIDDVGKVKAKDPSFTQSVYFNIIDWHYTNQAPVILTTNLDYADLEAHIGGACADRLREMCGKDGFIKMAGKSYRLK